MNYRISLWIVFACAANMSISGCRPKRNELPTNSLSGHAVGQGQSTPISCINLFFDSLNSGDFQKAGMCIDGTPETTTPYWSAVKDNLKRHGTKFMVSDIHIDSGQNSATMTYSLGVRNFGEADHKEHVIIDKVQLRLITDTWKLVPDPESKLTSLGATSIATLFAFPTYAPESAVGKMMNGDSDKQDAISKERILGLAFIEYAEDHGEKLTINPDTFLVDLIQYLPDHDTTRFESCLLGEYDGTMFTFNKRIQGKSIMTNHASETILVYEGAGEKFSFHHNGKTAVLFEDGHTKLVTPEQTLEKDLVQWNP